MSVKLLTEHHFEFLSLKRGCIGQFEYTLVKMPHWWKSHVAAHYVNSPSSNLKDVMEINRFDIEVVHLPSYMYVRVCVCANRSGICTTFTCLC